MESSAEKNEGLQRQITELKETINKINDNQRSLLELIQQNKRGNKALEEKVDILSENNDDVKTAICHVGTLVEKADKKAEEALTQSDKLKEQFAEHAATTKRNMEFITKEMVRFHNEISEKIRDALDGVSSNKLATDKIANSFGSLLSKSNQALDCIEILQDRLTHVENEQAKSKQVNDTLTDKLNKLKRKQKKKSKNVTLVIK